MSGWLKRLLPIAIVLGVLVWQPLLLLLVLLAPGIVIGRVAASAFDMPATGVHLSVPLLPDTAIGLVPLAAIGFWFVTCLVLLALRQRWRRS